MLSNNDGASKTSKESLHPLLIALVLAGGIVLGYLINAASPSKPSVFSSYTYDKMDDLLDYIENNYVDSIDRSELEEKAIVELLMDLDPHSYYIPATEMVGIEEDMQGNFEGIGVQFLIEKDTVRIESPIQGGPSEKVGIEAGDLIITIEDSLVAGVGITNSDVMKLLKGPKGTSVNLEVLRNSKILAFTIVRDKIPLYSVDIAYLIKDKTGYLKINRFSATTYDEFMKGMEELLDQGMESLILDLRNNPGGYLQAAVDIADEFLSDKKLIVYTEGLHQRKYEYSAGKKGVFEKGKLVVLLDQNSASASEILAGAIQDWDRGLIIGRRSFGKGLVQDQHLFPDNSALRLTIARYYTPSGRSIQKPYEDKQAYFLELDERYLDGELLGLDSNQNKQDTVKYYTLIEKKEVYGGGGISPDIFVPIDTSYANLFVAQLRASILPFLHDYKSKSESELTKYELDDFVQKFQVSDKMLGDFISFAQKQSSVELGGLNTTYSRGLKILLKANLAKQLFYNEGFFKAINQEDQLILEAIKSIEGN
ncbi:MAG: S41 family peptidase [Chitinophagales bacterium]